MVCEVVPCAIHGCSLANDSVEGRCHLAEAHAGNGQGRRNCCNPSNIRAPFDDQVTVKVDGNNRTIRVSNDSKEHRRL